MNKRAFTLIELMVAMGVMGMIIFFTSIIFKFGIDAHRISSANAEIMQKARVITEQLNSDFRGLRKDAPLMIWFERDRSEIAEPNRYDQIMFFANGDFCSYRLYRDTSDSYVDLNDVDLYDADDYYVKGNLARIYYSIARSYADNSRTTMLDPDEMEPIDRILARRVHIMTADPCLVRWPDVNDKIANSFDTMLGGDYYNDLYEHDRLPLSRYKTGDVFDNGAVLHTCFDHPPLVDTRDTETFHRLMSESVSSFAIQWAYWERDFSTPKNAHVLRWFPSDDPDDDPNTTYSQLVANGVAPLWKFGVHFNMPQGSGIGDWDYVDQLEYRSGDDFYTTFYPEAFKFTFIVHDSKGIIEGGRKFTHIVYLED